MSPILQYADIEMSKVDRLLAEQGEVLVSLRPSRAKLCIAFIETARASHIWRKLPILGRGAALVRGLGTTLKILLHSPRLFELGRLVAVNASSQTWEVSSDGQSLFRFRK